MSDQLKYSELTAEGTPILTREDRAGGEQLLNILDRALYLAEKWAGIAENAQAIAETLKTSLEHQQTDLAKANKHIAELELLFRRNDEERRSLREMLRISDRRLANTEVALQACAKIPEAEDAYKEIAVLSRKLQDFNEQAAKAKEYVTYHSLTQGFIPSNVLPDVVVEILRGLADLAPVKWEPGKQ